MTLTKPIPLYYPTTLVINTTTVHISAARMRPSWNDSFVTLTSLYHHLGSGYFSHVTYPSHPFRCSDLTTDGPLTCPVHSPCTVTAISYPSRDLSEIFTGCSSIGIASPSGGCRV